jgi:flagellar assembly protein FliH
VTSVPKALGGQSNDGGTPRLTLESVLAWLGSQDERTRAQLAARLAPEMGQVRLTAAKEGYAAGEEKGVKEVQARMRDALVLIHRAAREAESALATEAPRLAEACADIVIEVLTRMAGPALASRQAALQLVLQVLRRVQEEREVVVKVSPSDLPVLTEAQDALRAAFGGRKLEVAADPRVELGGCLVETRLGSFDGRLETQLRVVFEAIHAARAAREEHP